MKHRRDSVPRAYSFTKERDAANRRFELEFVTRIMLAADGNVSKAARLAGMHRRTIYTLLRKHRLQHLTKRHLGMALRKAAS